MKRYTEKKLYETLYEMKKEYTEAPVFLYRSGQGVKEAMYSRFLEDVEQRRRYYAGVPYKRIGLWAFNSYEWIIGAMGMLLAGKTLVLLDVNLGERDLRTLAHKADVEIIVADEALMDYGKGFEGEPVPMMPLGSFEDLENYGNAEGLEDGESLGEPGEEGEIICFTSGTSDSAKGVVIPAATLGGAIAAGVAVFSGKAGDRYYVPLPYYHIYGFTQVLHILKRGGTVCIGQGKYLKKDMEIFRPHVAVLVPAMIQYLINQDSLGSPLSAIIVGGALLTEELAQSVEGKGIFLDHGYGLSETLGEICLRVKGKGYQWMKAQEGVRFILSSHGELGIYLPFHMKEYYKKPEETAAVLDKEKHLFWTGDAAEMDEDGCVRVLGRLRDTIVLENGEKVHAEDMDREIAGLPGVKEAAAIGVHGHLEAVIVREQEFSEEEIIKAVKGMNKEKALHARIAKVWFQEEKLPRTSTGKLKRFLLEDIYQ